MRSSSGPPAAWAWAVPVDWSKTVTSSSARSGTMFATARRIDPIRPGGSGAPRRGIRLTVAAVFFDRRGQLPDSFVLQSTSADSMSGTAASVLRTSLRRAMSRSPASCSREVKMPALSNCRSNSLSESPGSRPSTIRAAL